jgi:alkanesulfonate monooxygenase SsuD/methylene tetrahydromethanopterin reductase-like flavin-dependent oxidoreductase (luciferase family)
MPSLRFGVWVPTHDAFANPKWLVKLGELAEKTGWNDYFLWDHVWMEPPPFLRGSVDEGHLLHDTWTILAAVATRTREILIGPMVSPLTRDAPWEIFTGLVWVPNALHACALSMVIRTSA